MVNFDISKEWVILIPPDATHVKKAAEDLSRYIGLLACLNGNHSPKQPLIMDASGPAPSGAVIVLNSENHGPERNGFSWRAGAERVEIQGESGRGLCNGIYSFLAALGISWPAPGKENLPSCELNSLQTQTRVFQLTIDSAHEPSFHAGNNPAAAPLRRFLPAGKMINSILKKSEAFTAWAARKRYDAIVLPLTVFAVRRSGSKLKQLKTLAGEYGIVLEAGGRDLSSMVPRKYFFFHKDFFRMEEGKRTKEHHFCPTNPGAIGIIGKDGRKLLQAAGDIKIFHLWPDKGEETTWCACPTCRAFSPPEQNRIAVNAAADVLSDLNPGAYISYYEKPDENVKIPMRKNLFKMERLPDEKECFDR